MGDTKTGNEKAAFPTDAIIEAPLWNIVDFFKLNFSLLLSYFTGAICVLKFF